jgi:hypothetical protein
MSTEQTCEMQRVDQKLFEGDDNEPVNFNLSIDKTQTSKLS